MLGGGGSQDGGDVKKKMVSLVASPDEAEVHWCAFEDCVQSG